MGPKAAGSTGRKNPLAAIGPWTPSSAPRPLPTIDHELTGPEILLVALFGRAHPARPQDAGDLAERRLGVEPVERLRSRDDVGVSAASGTPPPSPRGQTGGRARQGARHLQAVAPQR